MSIDSWTPSPLPLLSQQSVASEKNTYSYKGVEYTFVDTVHEDLVCPICHQLLDEAQQTPCGHLFCKKCLERTRNNGMPRSGARNYPLHSRQRNVSLHNHYFSCPVCREQHSCNTSESMNDKYNERRVTSLRVKCPNVHCDWEGSVGTVDNHKRIHCLFENVSCSEGCGTFVLRRNLQSHIDNECRLRTSFCKFCHQEGTHEFITTDHCRECDVYPIECPNQCGETVAQKKIETHLGKCPMQDIECRYSVFGCTSVAKRSETDQHEAEHKDYHLHLSLEKMSLLFQTVADMYSVVQSLSQKLPTVQDKPRRLYSCSAAPEPMSLPPNPLASFTRRPWLENKKLFPSSPWIFKLNGFKRRRRERKVFYWKLFSHPAGYRFVIPAEVKWVRDEPHDYISAYCYTEDGPNDSTLEWPFSGSVTVTLLNQAEDRYHITRTIPLRKETKDVPAKAQGTCARSVEQEGYEDEEAEREDDEDEPAKAQEEEAEQEDDEDEEEEESEEDEEEEESEEDEEEEESEEDEEEEESEEDPNCQYLKDDCLFFRMEITCSSSLSRSPVCLAAECSFAKAPLYTPTAIKM